MDKTLKLLRKVQKSTFKEKFKFNLIEDFEFEIKFPFFSFFGSKGFKKLNFKIQKLVSAVK